MNDHIKSILSSIACELDNLGHYIYTEYKNQNVPFDDEIMDISGAIEDISNSIRKYVND
jgi:hypothetical protein